MKLCFPIANNQGLDSAVFDHFGSAPLYLVVDSESEQFSVQENCDKGHSHGACNPAGAVQGLGVEGIVVGGIGRGALMSLNRAGYRVFQAKGQLVRDTLADLKSAALQEFSPASVCGGHASGHGAGHGHGGGCCH